MHDARVLALKAGNKLHAIEGDWPMMIVEPVPAEDWSAFAQRIRMLEPNRLIDIGSAFWIGNGADTGLLLLAPCRRQGIRGFKNEHRATQIRKFSPSFCDH